MPFLPGSLFKLQTFCVQFQPHFAAQAKQWLSTELFLCCCFSSAFQGPLYKPSYCSNSGPECQHSKVSVLVPSAALFLVCPKFVAGLFSSTFYFFIILLSPKSHPSFSFLAPSLLFIHITSLLYTALLIFPFLLPTGLNCLLLTTLALSLILLFHLLKLLILCFHPSSHHLLFIFTLFFLIS